MTDCGIGISTNCFRVIRRPVAKHKNLYDPWRFPVGPRQIAPWVRSAIVLDGIVVLMHLHIRPERESTMLVEIQSPYQLKLSSGYTE